MLTCRLVHAPVMSLLLLCDAMRAYDRHQCTHPRRANGHERRYGIWCRHGYACRCCRPSLCAAFALFITLLLISPFCSVLPVLRRCTTAEPQERRSIGDLTVVGPAGNASVQSCLVYDLSPRLVHHAATVGGCAGEARRRWLLRLRPRLSVRLGTRPVPSRPTPARLRARAGLWCRYRKLLLSPDRSVCRGWQPSVECCWGGRSSVLAWSVRARVRLP